MIQRIKFSLEHIARAAMHFGNHFGELVIGLRAEHHIDNRGAANDFDAVLTASPGADEANRTRMGLKPSEAKPSASAQTADAGTPDAALPGSANNWTIWTFLSGLSTSRTRK